MSAIFFLSSYLALYLVLVFAMHINHLFPSFLQKSSFEDLKLNVVFIFISSFFSVDIDRVSAVFPLARGKVKVTS